MQKPTDEIEDISSVSRGGIEVKQAYGWNKVWEVGIGVFEETRGI